MRKSNRTWTAALAALTLGLAIAMPAPADAAVVICQKGNRLKLRVDACKGKETAVDPSELGVEVPDGGVTVAKLAPGATAATGSITLLNQEVVSTANTTPTTLDRFTVDVPAAGVLHVTVAGQYWLDADAGSTDSLLTTLNLGLCDSMDSNVDCENTYDYFYYQDADNAVSSNSTHGFTLTRTVTVDAAGPRTFYVNGNVEDAAHTLYLWGCDFSDLVNCNGGPVATVTFVPGSLNITRPIL